MERADSDSDDMLDMGFMYDEAAAKSSKVHKFRGFDVPLTFLDGEPGAVQSGHYVWPGASIFCSYICDNWEKYKQHKKIVELGAGVGLVGLVACHLGGSPTEVALTDHDPGVLRQIDSNISDQNFPKGNSCTSVDLEWGQEGTKTVAQLIDQLGAPSLVLGSDVIYGVGIVEPLFWTAATLLRATEIKGGISTAVFLMCSSFSYEPAIEAAIDEKCAKYGFRRQIISCALAEGGPRIQSFTLLRKERVSASSQQSRLIAQLQQNLLLLQQQNKSLKAIVFG